MGNGVIEKGKDGGRRGKAVGEGGRKGEASEMKERNKNTALSPFFAVKLQEK